MLNPSLTRSIWSFSVCTETDDGSKFDRLQYSTIAPAHRHNEVTDAIKATHYYNKYKWACRDCKGIHFGGMLDDSSARQRGREGNISLKELGIRKTKCGILSTMTFLNWSNTVLSKFPCHIMQFAALPFIWPPAQRLHPAYIESDTSRGKKLDGRLTETIVQSVWKATNFVSWNFSKST